MRPPSHRPRSLLAPLLMVVAAAVSPAAAEEAAPLPTCQPTVTVPPPEPPARPESLAAERPSNLPIGAAPLPPERPAELAPVPDAPAPQVEPSQIALPSAPLPPERPPELSSGLALQLKVAPPVPADRPTCAPTVEAPPLPPGRPAELSPNSAPSQAAHQPEITLSPTPPDEAPLPPTRPPELSGDEAAKLAIAEPEDTECLRRLDALGVQYAKLTPTVNGQCSLPHPLSVSVLASGIGIGAPTTMTCRLAEGLTRWTAQVQQTADTEFGEALKGFTLAGTYVCRGQNHGAEAQLSEHSFANAVDVMGFTFAKRAPILVGALPEGSKEAAFVSAVRTKACEDFSTVLGPGSDEHHANHLHLDQRQRKTGYRLCQ